MTIGGAGETVTGTAVSGKMHTEISGKDEQVEQDGLTAKSGTCPRPAKFAGLPDPALPVSADSKLMAERTAGGYRAQKTTVAAGEAMVGGDRQTKRDLHIISPTFRSSFPCTLYVPSYVRRPELLAEHAKGKLDNEQKHTAAWRKTEHLGEEAL
jgi:hypothetical protein